MIISSILFLILIIIEIFFIKQNKLSESIISQKTKRLIYIFILIDVILSSIIVVFNIQKYNLYNTLILYILFFPLEIINLKNTISKEDEDISCTEYVIYNKIISKKEIHSLNKASIKVIILSNETPNYNIKTYEKKDIKKGIFKENILLKDTDINDIKKYLHNYEENISLKEIQTSRGKYDNYLRSIERYITNYIPLYLCFILFVLLGYPLIYNVSFLLIIKLINVIINKYIYEKLPYDTDLMQRSVREKGKMFYKQELFFLFIKSSLLFFGLTICYSYIISFSNNLHLALSIFYITYLYMNLFITYVIYSEKIFIINFVKSFLNYKMIIYFILTIIGTISLIYFKKFDIINIGIKNYFGCIIIALFFTIIFDIIKLARYTSVRK